VNSAQNGWCMYSIKCLRFTVVQGLHTLSVDMDICIQAFDQSPAQVRANIARANNLYGGKANFQATRVLFPNGEVDPWKAGGVLESPKGSVEEPTLMVLGASHHFWTHPSLPTDSAEVNDARQKIWAQVDKWLAL
jgi:serine protease 16